MNAVVLPLDDPPLDERYPPPVVASLPEHREALAPHSKNNPLPVRTAFKDVGSPPLFVEPHAWHAVLSERDGNYTFAIQVHDAPCRGAAAPRRLRAFPDRGPPPRRVRGPNPDYIYLAQSGRVKESWCRHELGQRVLKPPRRHRAKPAGSRMPEANPCPTFPFVHRQISFLGMTRWLPLATLLPPV